MRTYTEGKNGSIHIGKTGFPPSETNRLYRQMQKEVAAEEAELLPYELPADERTYRDKRQARYIAELSTEGDFQKTVGDMLKALFEAHYGDTTKLDILATKIAGIKTDIPEE